MKRSSHKTNICGHTEYGGFVAYLMGFLISVALTFVAYYIVVEKILTGWTCIITISILGLMQALAQLILFLHLGQEDRPRWNMAVFLFMALIVVIIVFGSLWIMDNLNYRMMPNM